MTTLHSIATESGDGMYMGTIMLHAIAMATGFRKESHFVSKVSHYLSKPISTYYITFRNVLHYLFETNLFPLETNLFRFSCIYQNVILLQMARHKI